ncbi:hypothetical protein [Microlunatus sp. GCM10028923]|uniref:hypothetical protein n=1 Tax=Microlunatus sp. GCM10028923 TaxID=3273400 RepID=UPI003605F698
MITVHVDRDSVAMGDDVLPHVVAWEFDDDATPGDVLVRVLAEGYLARVAGEVAWAFEVGAFDLDRYPDFTALRPRQTLTAAVVLQPGPGQWSALPLRGRVLAQPFLGRPDWAAGDREFAVNFHYASEGQVLDLPSLTGRLGTHAP